MESETDKAKQNLEELREKIQYLQDAVDRYDEPERTKIQEDLDFYIHLEKAFVEGLYEMEKAAILATKQNALRNKSNPLWGSF